MSTFDLKRISQPESRRAKPSRLIDSQSAAHQAAMCWIEWRLWNIFSDMAAKYPFNDLHSFKDYVGFVRLCAPDLFPAREGVGPEDQWTLDYAFAGLRLGLKMAEKEKGPKPVFTDCAHFVDQAEKSYCAGDLRAGFTYLDNVKKLLARVPSQ